MEATAESPQPGVDADTAAALEPRQQVAQDVAVSQQDLQVVESPLGVRAASRGASLAPVSCPALGPHLSGAKQPQATGRHFLQRLTPK